MLMKLFLFSCFDCEKKEEKFLLLGVMKTIIAKKTKNSREINKTLYAVLTEKRKRNKSGRKPNYYKFVASRILLDKKNIISAKKALYPDYFFVLIEKTKFFFVILEGEKNCKKTSKILHTTIATRSLTPVH